MQTSITSPLIKKLTALLFFCFILGKVSMSQPLCNAHFTHQPSGTVNGVHFISSPNASVLTTYAWSFGDGGTSTDPNPVHTYAPGNYLACLVVTVPSSNGTILCTATFCDSIHIGQTTVNCNAHFTHTGNTSNNGVQFTNAVNPAGTTYSWTFGDGGTSMSPNPNHIYAPGNYLACLTVTYANFGSVLCTATFCDSIHVGPNPVNCNAHFTHQNNAANNNVYFNSGINPAGTLYSWTFGDGGTSTAPNPHHQYAPGHYLACLTVTRVSLNGTVLCTATFCDSVHVGPIAVNCNAHFTHQATSAGEHFSSGPNPAGTVYAWTFGDGGTSSNPNPTHLYAAGHYQVCLTVTVMSPTTGNVLCTTNHCDSIHIGNNTPNCHANFNYHHLSSPFTYGFTNLSSPNATGYMWHFGDATTSNLANPVHHYMSPGIYQVCVTMFDTIHHCSKTKCKIVNASFAMAPVQASTVERLTVENTDNLSVTVYPNPTADKATIHIENATSEVSFKLYDSTGKSVIEKNKLTNGDFELNNSAYAPGIYYYRVTDENNSLVSGKLMIQK